MKSAKRILLKAIRADLVAYLPTVSLTLGVYRTVPAQEPLDYILLGTPLERPDGDKTNDTSDIDLGITVWSSSIDTAETVAGVIQERLTGNAKLTLDSPFVTLDQKLVNSFDAQIDDRPKGVKYGASILLNYLINHS